MSRDSVSTYVHLKESHYVQYSATWVHDKLPNDPIEAATITFDFDDDNEHSSIQNSAFGAIKNNSHRDPVWKDLQLEQIISDDQNWWKSVQDSSVLKVLDRVNLDNDDDPLLSGSSEQRQPISSTRQQQMNDKHESVTTPEMLRNRGGQRTMQNYQTPIGRTMR